MRTQFAPKSVERRELRRAVLALLATTFVALGASADVASSWTSSETWDGLSEFSRLAGRRVAEGRLLLTSTLPLSELSPEDSVIVMMPEVRLETDSLTRFLADGGRLAILDDYGTSGPLLERFSIRLSPSPLEPRERIRDSAALAIATPVRDTSDGPSHPLAEGVEKVVTNHPRVLDHPSLSSVLGIADAKGVTHSIAITGVVAGKGRLIVVSDPSIFINWMLRYPDNRRFAANLLEALGAGAPSGKVWFVSGVFAQTGHYGDTSWLEHLRKALGALEELRSDVEEDGLPGPLALGIALFALFSLFTLEVLPGLRRPGDRPPLFARASSPETTTPEAGRARALAAARDNLDHHIARVVGDVPSDGVSRGLSLAGLSAEDIDQLLSLRATLGRDLARRSPRDHDILHGQAHRFVELLARAPRTPS